MRKIYLFLLIIFSGFILTSCNQDEKSYADELNLKEEETSKANKQDESEYVKLLYSGNFISTDDPNEFDNYDEYLNHVFNLELEESFLEDNTLYTYSFLNNRIGSNLYKLYSYNLVDEILNIELKETGALALDAFGGHTLIFSIKKDYFKLAKEINITGIWEKDDRERFYIFTDDEFGYITNILDYFYYEGDEVIIQTDVLYDASLELYINDEFHSRETVVETNEGYKWEYYLTMPNKDVKISFKVVESFLVDETLLDTITFGVVDYNYKNVYKPANNLLEYKDDILQKYNLNLSEDIVVVEDYKAFSEIYEILMGEQYSHDLTPEEYVWILVNRKAGGSQFISIEYYFHETFISYKHPHGREAGDAAIFNCLDIITILKEDFNKLESLEFDIMVEILPIDDKIYWEGSIDDSFSDNEVIIIADRAYTNIDLTLEDFKDLNLDIISIELLGPSSINKDHYNYENYRKIYLLKLKTNDKEKVVRAINVLITSKYIYYAGSNNYYEVENPVEGLNNPYFDNYMKLIKARAQFINEDGSYNDYYGGAYVNKKEDKFEYVILVYGDYIPVEYEDVIYKYVLYSYNYLLSIMEEVTNLMIDYNIVLTGIDEKENKLLIQVKDESVVSLIINHLDELIEDFDFNSIIFDVNPEGEIIPV